MRRQDGKVIARIAVFFQRIEQVAHMGAVALHHARMALADDDGRKARAAPVGLGRDGDVAGVMALPLPLALYSLPEVPSSRSPKLAAQAMASMEPDAMRYSTGSSSCRGRDLPEVLEVPATRKVEGLRAVACTRQDHALLVEGHHGRVVAVGERVPVLARGIGGVCLIVVVRKMSCRC